MLHSNSLEGLFQSPCCSQAGHWRRDAAAGRLGQRRGGRWRLAGRGGALVEGAQVDGARHQPVLAVVRVLAPSVEDHPSGGERKGGMRRWGRVPSSYGRSPRSAELPLVRS